MGTCSRFNQSEKHQYTDLKSVSVLILPVFRQLLQRNGSISVKYLFWNKGADSKVISQAFWLTLVLYVFKLVLHFNSTIAKNQITYHLARNRGNFLQIQSCFYSHASPLSTMKVCYWKSTYPKLKEVNAWNMNVSSIILEGHKVSLSLWQMELK